jgi:hypothetical protein
MSQARVQLAAGNWQQAGKRYPVDKIIAACRELSASSWLSVPAASWKPRLAVSPRPRVVPLCLVLSV